MGKSGRWLRRLLGGKKTPAPDSEGKPPKKKWSFVGSFKDKERAPVPAPAPGKRQGSYWEGCCNDEAEQHKHAIAVAAATAAVAEAAVAAAQAAAAVVRLTSSGPYGGARREDLAALRIQTAFRGYLARRALRALKGLVKLQALVRGHIIRKQAAETLRCMQVLVRVQTRARANRALFSDGRNLTKPIPSNTGHETREKDESTIRVNKTKQYVTPILKGNTSQSHIPDAYLEKNQMGYWNHFNRRMDNRAIDDGNNDKILEIDTGKQNFISNRKNTAQQSRSAPVSELPDSPSKDSTTAQISNPSPSSVEMQALSPLRFTIENDDSVFDTAENSPQFYSASSSRRGPFTPSKSECSSSFLCHPSYMANTESSRAKVRSQSAPKQRPEFEKPGYTKRFSVNGISDVTATGNVERSSLQIGFTRKAYPGSGRLDRLGMPVNR